MTSMEWVRKMNNIRNRATEIVNTKGRHRIYTGGKYDSYLYLPVIPDKK